ncbi:hypothetical protein CKO35_08790 [Ectothiorhodospira shaposhnikovii]|uniref:hemerythrin domain-containing protein n=1 Tax=Ectothiorhodospira shaposhnikovii TaxID=1054 RepID=UPI0019086458|nr:hemerythrin domain-containing protein [Ectothiorhodospira shaposhnikovii]MBK1673404.1 hypothetical protein [Ectothiorhodospira shaposhnikovii]
METIQDFFTTDHRECDYRLADLEFAIADGDWEAADAGFREFHHDMERHLQREETLLFPAIESVSGGTMGPTEVMRREHDQMRALMEEIRIAKDQRDENTTLGVIETLMTMIQLHNVKEEQILYPMADRFLQTQRGELMAQVKALEP